jgi:hypothetical protein
MKEFNEGQKERIKKRVEEEYEICQVFDPGIRDNNRFGKEPYIDTGVSILSAEWGIGFRPGGFIQAIIDNNLMGAFSRADNINVHGIRFYCHLLRNVEYID